MKPLEIKDMTLIAWLTCLITILNPANENNVVLYGIFILGCLKLEIYTYEH